MSTQVLHVSITAASCQNESSGITIFPFDDKRHLFAPALFWVLQLTWLELVINPASLTSYSPAATPAPLSTQLQNETNLTGTDHTFTSSAALGDTPFPLSPLK